MSPSLESGHVCDCFGQESVEERCYETSEAEAEKARQQNRCSRRPEPPRRESRSPEQAGPRGYKATVPGGLSLRPSSPRWGHDSEAAFPRNTMEWPPCCLTRLSAAQIPGNET